MGGALFWGVGFTSYTAIMGHMGVDAAAANSVSAVVRGDLICCACTCLDEVGKIPWVMHRFRKYKWVQNLTKEMKGVE